MHQVLHILLCTYIQYMSDWDVSTTVSTMYTITIFTSIDTQDLDAVDVVVSRRLSLGHRDGERPHDFDARVGTRRAKHIVECLFRSGSGQGLDANST